MPADHGPGALHSEAWLAIQTRQAQRLVTGRRAGRGKPAIVGLFGFATLIRAIWTGALADDPYADWWLVRVHEALDGAEAALRQRQAPVAAQLAALPAIETALAASVEPVRVPLTFGSPYPFRGARLIAAFDTLARTVLTARHVGCVATDEAERILALGGRAVRRAFTSAQGYRGLGITRADVLQGAAKALRARALMGELPPDILTGVCRALHAPSKPLLPPDAASVPAWRAE